MKRQHLLFITLAVLVIVGAGLGYANRTALRAWWSNRNAPALPTAVHKLPLIKNGGGSTQDDGSSPVEGGVSTSTHFTLISSPQKTSQPSAIDPLAVNGDLPKEMNLDVPFTSQAPLGDWSYPYQEACEEASAIMVDSYYKGVSGTIDPQAAKKAIDAVVFYENQNLGYYKDTPSTDVVKFINGSLGYDALILPLTSADDLKRAIANGYPVLVPFNGKALANPNFKNGGPLYHMLVVKGYTADHFITNDPGTHLGKNFTYTYSNLMDSAHDWVPADNKADGPAVMVIIIPHAA